MNYQKSVEGQLAENVLKELETEFTERTSRGNTINRASTEGIMNQIDIGEKRESIKKDIVKMLQLSNQTQRIYFVVRSMIMAILGAIITLAIFWRLGTINVLEDFVLGISTYVICLFLSRLFNNKIVNVSQKIIAHLEAHTKSARLLDFIVKNL